MADAEASVLDIDAVSELVRHSEIDFQTLMQHVVDMLARQSQASIGDLLAAFPAEQGLGSVVGYVALGAKHGEIAPESEIVSWVGDDRISRRARVPAIYFVRERVHEFSK